MDAGNDLTERWQRALRKGPAAVPEIESIIDEVASVNDFSLAAQLQVEVCMLLVRAGRLELADQAMSRAQTFAKTSDDFVTRGIIAGRYVAFLVAVENFPKAVEYCQALQDTLLVGTPLPLRLVGLAVATDVAASTGDWRRTDELCRQLREAADGVVGAEALFAQADLGEAAAAVRLGDSTRALLAGRRCLERSIPLQLDVVTSSALAVLSSAGYAATLQELAQMEHIIDRRRELGDIANAASIAASAGFLYCRRGETVKALELLEYCISATESAPFFFLNAKARIWAIPLRDKSLASSELEESWSRLRSILVDLKNPNLRRQMVQDWAGMVDQLLQLLEPLDLNTDPVLADIAVDVFAVAGADSVASAIETGGNEVAGRLVDEIETLWRDPGLTADQLKMSLHGVPLLAYRTVAARADEILAWRLWVDESGAVSIDQLHILGDAAFELKLIAEGHSSAPTNSSRTWSTLGGALLPAWRTAPSRLVVAPHGPLWAVPFAALLSNGRPLVATTSISSVTSLAMPMSSTHPTIGRSVAAIDGSLPHVAVEVDALRSLSSSLIVCGSADEVRRALDDAEPNTLLLAAHGTGRGGDFEIALGGRVGMAELGAWRMPRLVLAPSCFSGRQSFENWPPGLVSMAFLHGTRWFLGALWDVPSVQAAIVTRSFMTHLDRSIQPPEALRLAQLEAGETYPHVVDWAGFSLFGWSAGDRIG